MDEPTRLPLALTLGEPAGIGPELSIAIWSLRDRLSPPPFFALGDPEFYARRARDIEIDLPIVEIDPEDGLDAHLDAFPVVATGHTVIGTPGAPDQRDVGAVIAAITQAVDHVFSGHASAIVTNPIQKKSLYDAGFEYPGHTEFLAAYCGQKTGSDHDPIMMLAGPELRAIPATIHIPLCDVSRALTSDRIENVIRTADGELRSRFAIDRPRIAVAGLNPHAGESGALGREDIDIIHPAIRKARDSGIDVDGPLPADTMFHSDARARYDVAIAMYHDQALIPVKTIAFDETVNVTLGLPIIRTSPDHGTALDIAGRGTARPTSLYEAMKLAARLAENETGRGRD